MYLQIMETSKDHVNGHTPIKHCINLAIMNLHFTKPSLLTTLNVYFVQMGTVLLGFYLIYFVSLFIII